jgi:hypothetical protein
MASRPTKLHTLLAGVDTWTPELRDEVVDYLYDRCSHPQMFKFAVITGRQDITEWLYVKREKLAVLTELLTPQELLAAWGQVRDGVPVNELTRITLYSTTLQ